MLRQSMHIPGDNACNLPIHHSGDVVNPFLHLHFKNFFPFREGGNVVACFQDCCDSLLVFWGCGTDHESFLFYFSLPRSRVSQQSYAGSSQSSFKTFSDIRIHKMPSSSISFLRSTIFFIPPSHSSPGFSACQGHAPSAQRNDRQTIAEEQ